MTGAPRPFRIYVPEEKLQRIRAAVSEFVERHPDDCKEECGPHAKAPRTQRRQKTRE